jgi:hypothetical protein
MKDIRLGKHTLFLFLSQKEFFLLFLRILKLQAFHHHLYMHQHLKELFLDLNLQDKSE